MAALHEVIVGTLRSAVERSAGLAASDLKEEKKAGLAVHGTDRPAVPGLRGRGARGLVRRLGAAVLRDLPDRRQAAGRPPAVPPAEVAAPAASRQPRGDGSVQDLAEHGEQRQVAAAVQDDAVHGLSEPGPGDQDLPVASQDHRAGDLPWTGARTDGFSLSSAVHAAAGSGWVPPGGLAVQRPALRRARRAAGETEFQHHLRRTAGPALAARRRRRAAASYRQHGSGGAGEQEPPWPPRRAGPARALAARADTPETTLARSSSANG